MATKKDGPFDRFADRVADLLAKPGWFAVCLLAVGLWACLLPFFGMNNPVLHLWLNSPTTVLGLLMLALAQNTAARFERAEVQRWDALCKHLGIEDPVEDEGQKP